MSLRNTFITLFAVSGLGLIGEIAFTTSAHAAGLEGFNAGNIISDQIFVDNKSMTASQIQNFLESKNSVCLDDEKFLSLHDANNDGLGDEPYGKGTGNKVLASQLIYQAAQLYDINPQVILVTLQKEQGLITRTDCPDWRYNTALGFGCPDGEPCDESAYGLTRQIDYGVWHFRGFFDDTFPIPPTVPGSKFIAYNPNSSCGGKTITIQNRATAALYSYTPYQPNKATLNADWGEVVPCGAYGNTNFYRYFTAWFGKTHYGPFFKVSGSDKIYVHGGGETYYHVPSPYYMDTYGFSSAKHKIVTLSPSYLDNLTYKGLLSSQLVKFESSDRMYLADNGKLHYISSPSMLSAYGLGSSDIVYLDTTHLNDFKKASNNLSTVISPQGSYSIYAVESGKKRYIPTTHSYRNTGEPSYISRNVSELSSRFVNSLDNGSIMLADGEVVKSTTDNKLYLVNNKKLVAIPTEKQKTTGLSVTAGASQSKLAAYPIDTTLTFNGLVKHPDGSLYVLDSNKKHRITADYLSAYSLTVANFLSISNDYLLSSQFQTSTPLTNLTRNPNSGATYYNEAGKRYNILSPDDFSKLGYSWNNVVNLHPKTIDQLSTATGTRLFGSGKLLKVEGDDKIYVVDGALQLRHIQSPTMQRAYDLVKRLNYVSAAVVEAYKRAPLDDFAKDSSGNIWLVHDKRKYAVSDSLAAHYGIAKSTMPTTSSVVLSLKSGGSLTNLIQAPGSHAIYKVENGQKRHITSPSAFSDSGFKWSDVREVPASVVNSLPDGAPVS